MHIGVEVEGRLKGLKTLFISAAEYLHSPFLSKTKDYAYQHIYISDRGNILSFDDLSNFANQIDKIITIERTCVEENFENLNIILFVEKKIQNLKPTDQIKFDDGQYVWTTCIESMIKTVPEDFLGDTIV